MARKKKGEKAAGEVTQAVEGKGIEDIPVPATRPKARKKAEDKPCKKPGPAPGPAGSWHG